MRRRTREAPGITPPPWLQRFDGTTSRERLAWMRAREEWWDTTRDPDDGGWLPWLLDGWEQVGDLPWCGSVGAPCGDRDCLCESWPEHLALEKTEPTPQLNPSAQARRLDQHERNRNHG